MINNQWYNIQSMDDIQQIIADEFSDELANEFEKFKQKYTDADYWEVYGQLEEAESMLESAEDDAEYYKARLEEAGLLQLPKFGRRGNEVVTEFQNKSEDAQK